MNWRTVISSLRSRCVGAPTPYSGDVINQKPNDFINIDYNPNLFAAEKIEPKIDDGFKSGNKFDSGSVATSFPTGFHSSNSVSNENINQFLSKNSQSESNQVQNNQMQNSQLQNKHLQNDNFAGHTPNQYPAETFNTSGSALATSESFFNIYRVVRGL